MTPIEVTGISAKASSGLQLSARVLRALMPLGRAAQRCRVAFTDENGPKGGRDRRCRITVSIARRVPISVSAKDVAAARAFQEALDRLRRRLERTIIARRDASRHPTKYFIAARERAGVTPRETAAS
jgi:hypothetical protein